MSLRKKLGIVSVIVIVLMLVGGLIRIRFATQVRDDFIHMTDVTAPDVIRLGTIKVAGGRVVEEALTYTLLHGARDKTIFDPVFLDREKQEFEQAVVELNQAITAHRVSDLDENEILVAQEMSQAAKLMIGSAQKVMALSTSGPNAASAMEELDNSNHSFVTLVDQASDLGGQ